MRLDYFVVFVIVIFFGSCPTDTAARNLQGSTKTTPSGELPTTESSEERFNFKVKALFKKNPTLSKSLKINPSQIKAEDINKAKTAIKNHPEVVKALKKSPSQLNAQDRAAVDGFFKGMSEGEKILMISVVSLIIGAPIVAAIVGIWTQK